MIIISHRMSLMQIQSHTMFGSCDLRSMSTISHPPLQAAWGILRGKWQEGKVLV